MPAASPLPAPPVTLDIAEFIAGALPGDAPAKVLHLAKRSFLDGLGLALAGAVSEGSHLLRDYLQTLAIPRTSGSLLIGTPLRMPARYAALANGFAIHADDYDDTQLAAAPGRVYGLLMHPTAPALPAALALGEREGRSGLDVLFAYLVGVEVECKIAEAIDPRHYDHGFHTTGTIGTFGAAAAAARVLGLDVDATARALGIAGSHAGGLRENFGTMMKPFHAGRAAESGVVAAELAQHGFSATTAILEAGRGFFQAAGGGFDANALQGRLGHPWTFASPGVSIKPHPSGSLTHPGMGLMLDLVRKHDIRPEQVVKVKVGTNRHMPNTLIHRRPKNELQAKFSMEFCMAILLLERKAGLAEFTDAVVNRPDVQRMIGKIEFGVHPDAERAGYDRMTTIIEVALADGRTVGGRADFGKGSPDNPVSDAELAAKFRECAAWGRLPAAAADEIVERVFDLDKLRAIGGLTALLRPGVSPRKAHVARKARRIPKPKPVVRAPRAHTRRTVKRKRR